MDRDILGRPGQNLGIGSCILCVQPIQNEVLHYIIEAASGILPQKGNKGAAQRKLREAYFVAIVTPATKQFRKMLADFGAA